MLQDFCRMRTSVAFHRCSDVHDRDDFPSASDSTNDEPASKRAKPSGPGIDNANKENFHRDDPQIGVCLECLK